jgi:hypothetical protein
MRLDVVHFGAELQGFRGMFHAAIGFFCDRYNTADQVFSSY